MKNLLSTVLKAASWEAQTLGGLGYFSQKNPIHEKSFPDALIARGAKVDVVADSPQPEVLREMVNLGLGWTVLPRHQAESGDRPLLPSKVLAKRTLVLAFRSNAAIDPAVQALSSMLSREI